MRLFLIVLDGFGVGELPDAKDFGDVGSNTFENIYKEAGLNLPNLKKLGLYNLDGLHFKKEKNVLGSYAKMKEVTKAKDTTAGHFEIACSPIDKPLVTFKNGFDKELIEKIEAEFGTKTLCNGIASGTVVINELGDEHLKRGYPICYTSADSVFQIACHEKLYSNEQLYDLCEKARKVCDGKFLVGRVIARPFTGESGNFVRTVNRKDFSVKPPKETILDLFKKNGLDSIGIGKIEDIFPKDSLTKSFHTHLNSEAISKLLELQSSGFDSGLLFANLVDTDMLYGHRNDVLGYKKCLEEFDLFLEKFMKNMRDDDILVITADHGNDPTTPSTDHSREYVPMLMYGNRIKQNKNLGILPSFACLGYTILDLFSIKSDKLSFKNEVIVNEK